MTAATLAGAVLLTLGYLLGRTRPIRSADYCRLAAWRTTDAGERARALGVPPPPPVPDGQGGLFEVIA